MVSASQRGSRRLTSWSKPVAGCLVVAAVTGVVPAAFGQTTQPVATAGTADLGSPKAAVKTFVTAQINGDGKTIRESLLTTTPTEERMAGAIADLSVAIAELDRAMVAKFGPAPTQQLMGDPADALQANLSKLDRAKETITGDAATVVSPPELPPPGAPTPPPTTAPTPDNPTGSPQESMLLKKIGNQWKLSVSDLAKGSNDENIRKTLASVDTAVAGYRSVLSDLNTGKLISVDAVAAELNAKMAPNGATPPAAGTTPATGAPGTVAPGTVTPGTPPPGGAMPAGK